MWVRRVVATAAVAAAIGTATVTNAQAAPAANGAGPEVGVSATVPIAGGVGPAVHLCGLCWPIIR